MKKWLSPDTEQYLGLGLQLAGTILLGFFAGYYLDRKFGKLPLWTLVGCGLGMVLGMVNFFYQLKGLSQQRDE